MAKKELLKDSLLMARHYSNGLFAQFKTPDEWVHQTHPGANHPLWVAGHIANTDNFALSIVAPEKARDMPEHKAQFGGGSKPVNDASKYPNPDEILKLMAERRETVLAVLDGLSEDDLAKATPDHAPEFMPTVESVFRILSWHEGLHAGQASTANRALGNPPVMGG